MSETGEESRLERCELQMLVRLFDLRKRFFSGLLAISASSQKKYFGDKHFVTHLNESPLLITFFPLVQKFLNLKQNDDSCQRSFLLPNIFLLSKIFCCQRFVVVPKDNFGFQR